MVNINITDKTQQPVSINTGGTIAAFGAVTVNSIDPPATLETVTVTLGQPQYAYPSMTDLGTLVDPVSGAGTYDAQTHTFTESALIGANSPNFATALLQRLQYVAPSSLPSGMTYQVQATVGITDENLGTTVDQPIRFQINTPPVISDTTPNEPVAAGNSIRPFSVVQIRDGYSYGAIDTATITITDGGTATDGDGLLTGGGLSKTGVGTYSLAATSYYSLQSELEQLSFATGTLAAGQVVNPQFELDVHNSATGYTTTDTTTSLLVKGAPATPQIGGTLANQTVAPGQVIDPLHGVTITDGNAAAQDAVTITVTDDNGTASDATGTFGAEPWMTHTAGSGVYTLTATDPKTLTTELDSLVFSPAPLASGQTSSTSHFQIAVSDPAVKQSATDTTTSVIEQQAAAPPPPPNGGPDGNTGPDGTGSFQISDQTTGQVYNTEGAPYTGPVAGLSDEFVTNTSDILNVTAQTPNVFIEVAPIAGSPPPSEAGMNVAGVNGNNILDGYANSNFYTGGTGSDQFYEDARTLTQNSWSTIVNFHSGDNVTVWGVTAGDFKLDWIGDTEGAAGSTGLTGVLVPNAAGKPEVGITIAGMTVSDLSKLAVTYGTTSAASDGTPGSAYLSIHFNA